MVQHKVYYLGECVPWYSMRCLVVRGMLTRPVLVAPALPKGAIRGLHRTTTLVFLQEESQ